MLSAPFISGVPGAWAQEKLAGKGEVVVYSTGGSFTDNLRVAVFEPFTKATGINVIDVTAPIAEPQMAAMKRAGRVDWDVVIVQASTYPELHGAGTFVPINYSLWDQESIDGSPASSRLVDAV